MDPLGSLKLQFVAKCEKNEGGAFGDIQNFLKIKICEKNERGAFGDIQNFLKIKICEKNERGAFGDIQNFLKIKNQTLRDFLTSILLQIIGTIEGGTLWCNRKIFGKNSKLETAR